MKLTRPSVHASCFPCLVLALKWLSSYLLFRRMFLAVLVVTPVWAAEPDCKGALNFLVISKLVCYSFLVEAISCLPGWSSEEFGQWSPHVKNWWEVSTCLTTMHYEFKLKCQCYAINFKISYSLRPSVFDTRVVSKTLLYYRSHFPNFFPTDIF